MKRKIRNVLSLILSAGILLSSPAIQTFAEDDTIPETAVVESVTEENTEENTEEKAATEVVVEEAGNVQEPETVVEEVIQEPEGSTYAVSGNLFDDVSDNAWFLPYVTYTLNKGIMTGKGNNLFAPGEKLARAQFAVVLWRIMGSPEVEYTAKFEDVPKGTFYATAVEWASSESVGVISGYEEGNFGPNDNITREQLVTMLYRFAKYRELDLTQENDLADYPDATDVNEFAIDAMRWAVGNKILTGDKGKLNPQGNTNRAECAAMLQRFCEAFIPGELQDIELTAACEQTALTANEAEGKLWMKATGVSASRAIKGVQAKLWCNDNKGDLVCYNLKAKSDGTYEAETTIKNHQLHTGTYKMQMYVLLDVGVRIPVGSVQTATISVVPGNMQVMRYVENIYNTVGRDLNACYWWCVNNISYRHLPIPLPPAQGFTSAEWYAMQAFLHGSGNCYTYAAVFYFCAIGLGYDAHFIEGQVGLASGGYGPHGFVMINKNGGSYIYDPEEQRNLGEYNFYEQPVGQTILQYRW